MNKDNINRQQLLALNKTFEELKGKLTNYIGRVLHLAIRDKHIKKGFYSVQGILDEIYLMAFDDLGEHPEGFNPKVSLFRNAVNKMNTLMQRESIFKGQIPVEKLLGEELRSLEEKPTADGDGDLVLEEELPDISYHLEEDNEKIYLMDDHTREEIKADLEQYDKTLAKGQIKGRPGALTATIVELRLLGHLTNEEIAEVMDVSPENIQTMAERLEIE